MSSSAGCIGPNKQFEQRLPYDPSIWAVDEDDVLNFKDLYGSMGSHDEINSAINLQQMSHAPVMNGFVYPADIKPKFPLSNNHSMSMPILPIQNNESPTCQRNANTPNVLIHSDATQPQLPPQQPQPIVPDKNFICPSILLQNNGLQQCQPTVQTPLQQHKATHLNSENGSLITFVDLKSFYEKGQVRLQGKSEQRLDYSTSFVRIYIGKPDIIKTMTAFVERYPDAAHILNDSIGRIQIKILPGENPSWIKVNLDDAGCEVYKLSKVKGEERNRFHVGLEVLFHDGSRQQYFSETFQVKSKPKSNEYGDGCSDALDRTVSFEPDIKRKAPKRSRTDDSSDVMTSSPKSVGSVFPEVITDHLQATTATIDQLKIFQPIQTQRGDIAYHFKLTRQPSDPDLEEGDIIGFFETSEGKTEIKRLTSENVQDTNMAGVVSRSAWLEGRKPDEGTKTGPTDMVCVIGVVKVKVRGPVKNGERIYASLSPFPGVAMAENIITSITSNELTLIGQSLEAVEDAKPDEISLVSCFVSVLLSINTKYTVKAMEEIRSDVLVDVDMKISKEKSKCIRGLAWKLAILFVFLGLIAVLLYQLYAPQTAYRYWQCEKGSTGETSSFSFLTARQQHARVNGVEFEFDDLVDKLDLSEDTKKIQNHEDHHYYLNIDRCAAGGLRSGVHGPKFYVVDNNCTVVYYYLHNNEISYRKYVSQDQLECSHYVPSRVTKLARAVAPTTDVGQPDVPMKSDRSNNDTTPRHKLCYSDIEKERGSASFTYTSGLSMSEKRSVGVLVDLDVLRKKTNQTINELSQPGVRYYFNVLRCTGEGDGPRCFAMIGACDNAYYYSTSKERWIRYASAKEFNCSLPV